jgi:hypothetical protein
MGADDGGVDHEAHGADGRVVRGRFSHPFTVLAINAFTIACAG